MNIKGISAIAGALLLLLVVYLAHGLMTIPSEAQRASPDYAKVSETFMLIVGLFGGTGLIIWGILE